MVHGQWLFLPYAVIVAVSLALSGCANQDFKMVSVTYQYTDQNRTGREWRAFLDAQDQCYFAGYQYAQASGPPQIAANGMAGEYEAMRSYSCIGQLGGDG